MVNFILFIAASILSCFSAASTSLDFSAWAYTFRVMDVFAWPRRFDTVQMSVPFPISKVAEVCLRECKVT